MMLVKTDVLDTIQKMPDEFSLEDLIEQIQPTPTKSNLTWQMWFNELDAFAEDFMTERNQPSHQIRPTITFEA